MDEVNFNFSGKNFAVLGASSGMGKQIALELAASGANVLALARNKERLENLKSEGSGQIETAVLDALSEDDNEWNGIFEKFTVSYGKLNGGVYTAGITGSTPLKAYDKNLAKRMVEIGIWGGVHFLQFASKKMYSEAGASYVMFSSVAAHEGPKGILFYSAAKGAIQSAVKVASKEIARRGQRVNSISPGWIQTEMTKTYLDGVGIDSDELHAGPLGIGKPEDVSGMVLFLLSDRAKWITGRDFVIDGGYLSSKYI